jgi:hypothetical protein
MALADAKPTVDESNKGSAYLLTGLSLIAGALTAIGVKSDELANMWRNHAFLSHLGIAAILVAVALGSIAGWVIKGKAGDAESESKAKKWERICLLVGNALLALGLICITWAGLDLASDRPDPTIAAKAVEEHGETLLNVSVENSKLRADQDLAVAVEPLFETVGPKGELQFRVGRPFYSASLAPDTDGNVKRSVTVDIPPGRFEDVGVRASEESKFSCYEEADAHGCLVVRIPKRNEEPQLTFRWNKASRAGATLRAHVFALDIPGDALRFRALSLKPHRMTLAQATLAPNLHGDVDYTFALPVRGTRLLCVAASTAEQPLTCPPKHGEDPSWSRLRVPRQR